MEKALRAVPALKSLEVMSKICRNIHANPKEAKQVELPCSDMCPDAHHRQRQWASSAALHRCRDNPSLMHHRWHRFRKLRLTNSKIEELLVNVPNCLEALLEMGWEKEGENQEYLVFSETSKMSFDTVRKIENTLDFRRSEDERATLRGIK